LPPGALPADFEAPPAGKEVFLSFAPPARYHAVVKAYRGTGAVEAPPTPRPIDSPRLS